MVNFKDNEPGGNANSSQIIDKDFSRNVWCILGLPFDAINLDQTENEIVSAISEKRRCFLSTPNLNYLCVAQTDPAFRLSVINSDLSIADGFPVVLIAKLLHIPLPERVTGADLIDRLFVRKTTPPLTVFFFGGQPEAGELASQTINQKSSGLRSLGHYFPGFGSVSDMSTAKNINELNAVSYDFLIVALGAKKGQLWIEHNRQQLNAPVISHLGAVINFYSGAVKRAPAFMQRYCLEWLWRIFQEPDLSQRYFNDGCCFLGLLFRNILPYWIWLVLNKSTYNKISGVRVIRQLVSNETITLFLSGRCYYEDIEPLRIVFSNLSKKNKHIIIDLTNVAVIDGAFIGLILILLKHLIYHKKTLKLQNINNIVKKIVKWNKIDFLLLEY